MKRIIILLITLFALFSNINYSAVYATTISQALPNNQLLSVIEESKFIKNQLYVDVSRAYSSKLKKEDIDALTKSINYQLTKIERIRQDLLRDINNPSLDETYRKNALLLIIGIDYYMIGYQQLENYLANNDVTSNFSSLDIISYDLLTGEDTINRLEAQLKQ